MKIRTSLLRKAPKILKLWACLGVLPLLFAAPASAQSLVGVWSSQTHTPEGINSADFLGFNANGTVQHRSVWTDPTGRGSGQSLCQDVYQFNGQMVAMRWGGCQACGAGGCYSDTNVLLMQQRLWGGPFMVRFLNAYAAEIGGSVYHRQQ